MYDTLLFYLQVAMSVATIILASSTVINIRKQSLHMKKQSELMEKQAKAMIDLVNATLKSIEKPAIVEVVRYCTAPLKEKVKRVIKYLNETPYPNDLFLELDVKSTVKKQISKGRIGSEYILVTPTNIARLTTETQEILTQNLAERLIMILERYELRTEWEKNYNAYREKYKKLEELHKQVKEVVKNLLQTKFSNELHKAFQIQYKNPTRFEDLDAFKNDAVETFLENLNHLERGTKLAGTWHFLGENILRKIAESEEVNKLLEQLNETRYEMLEHAEKLLEILDTVLNKLIEEYKLTPTETTPPS